MQKTVQTQASYLPSLSLGFYICKAGVVKKIHHRDKI